MNLRYCIPVVAGKGGGLGNELIPWARAYLASKILSANCLHPAFGLNRFGYATHFGTSSLDWVWHRSLVKILPTFDFNEQAYLKYGGGDMVSSFKRFAATHGLLNRKTFAVTTSGMWGGMLHIVAAREFVRSRLYFSKYAARNLLLLHERLNPDIPVVGMHVRLGDFASPRSPTEYKARFNISLPIQWFRSVAQSIYEQLNAKVQFLVVSDAKPDALMPLTQGLPCISTSDMPHTDCSDLLALANSDLLVCSVSSYSVWAAFLSDAPYLWFEPHLTEHPEGWLSIWGHESSQKLAGSGTQTSLSYVASRELRNSKAWSVSASGDVPSESVSMMLSRRWDPSTDLIRYGVVKCSQT